MKTPKTRYAKTDDGAYIAYQTVGEGPIDLVWQPTLLSNIDVVWEWPHQARSFWRLASFARLILHDRRATGLSSRNVAVPDLETRVADLRRVLDEVGAGRVVLGGDFDGGAPNVLFAATEPARVRSLVWYGPLARTTWAPDYPWGLGPDEVEQELADLELWGTDEYGRSWLPNDPDNGDEATVMDAEIVAKLSRHTASPDVAREILRVSYETDIRDLLPAVRVPTLLMIYEQDAHNRDQAEYVASRISTSELAVLPGSGSTPNLNDETAAIEAFLGIDHEPDPDRVLATVLFTDIVDSTGTASVIGDARWRALIGEHDRLSKEIVDDNGGTYVKSTGDGLMATFDGPVRAIGAARSLIEAVRPLGVEIRAGAHTGEVVRQGGDLAGLGVHVAARVAAMAGPSQTWVSSTVKDLSAGSDLTFRDAGEHELRGVPERWHLYRVTA